jgi:hypothetical protein
MDVGISHADHATFLYPQKTALISPTSGVRSVGIVLSRTKTTEVLVITTIIIIIIIYNYLVITVKLLRNFPEFYGTPRLIINIYRNLRTQQCSVRSAQ